MKSKTVDSELLREGYKSYHKAVFAVMEFRRQASEIIENAVEKRWPELAAAMKMKETEFSICPYPSPARFFKKTRSYAYVGVRIPKSSSSKWRVYFYLMIGQEKHPYLMAEIYHKNLPSAKLKAAGAEGDERRAYISEDVPSDGSRDLGMACNRLLTRWISMWKKVGGFSQFLSKVG
jgi:hypothetical protein